MLHSKKLEKNLTMKTATLIAVMLTFFWHSLSLGTNLWLKLMIKEEKLLEKLQKIHLHWIKYLFLLNKLGQRWKQNLVNAERFLVLKDFYKSTYLFINEKGFTLVKNTNFSLNRFLNSVFTIVSKLNLKNNFCVINQHLNHLE